MSAFAMQAQPAPPQARPTEGVTVIGEAVRTVHPETAEFLIEIASSAPTAAHALREVQTRAAQIAQAVSSLGVHQSDLQTISMNVYNAWVPLSQQNGQMWGNPAAAYSGMIAPMPAYAGIPQALSGVLGASPQQVQATAFMPFGAPGMQPATLPPDLQFGQWTARNTIRVRVKDTGRLGDVLDGVSRAGANVLGAFSFQPSDEAQARRSALESAAKDARAKAEALASAAGKQAGDPVAVTEEFVTSNGDSRTQVPGSAAAGLGASGRLEYYARVAATFRLQ